MPITRAQSRAARGLLGISQGELAVESGVSLRTIQHFESGERQPVPATTDALERALTDAGVEFIAENGGGAGVRLRKRKGKRS